MWLQLVVGAARAGTATTWSVPADGSFTDVVNYASPGDTIVLDAGTYTDPPGLLAEDLFIEGDPAGGTLLQPPAALQVSANVSFTDLTVDGLGATQLLTVGGGYTLTLTRVTVRGGKNVAAFGGAVHLDRYAALVAVDSSFLESEGQEGGAVFADYDTTLDCTRCTFQDNTASGIDHDGGAVYTSGIAVFTDSIFSKNTNALYQGGALAVTVDGSAFVYGGSFEDNTATEVGGAIAVRYNASLTIGPSLVGETQFVGNEAAYGGAIGCDMGCSLTVTGARFTGNTATADGGHLYADNALSLSLTDATLEGGSAGADGGALAVDAGEVYLMRTNLCDNTAGRGAAVWSAGKVHLTNVSLIDNAAQVSGGALEAVEAEVSYTTAQGNGAPDGSAFLGTGLSVSLSSTVLVDQLGGIAVGGVPPITVADGATWNNAVDDYDATVTIVSSLELHHDPFPTLVRGLCAPPIPEWQGELVDETLAYTAAADRDGSEPDLGATGGPDADLSLWADSDGDGVVAMWDCNDADPELFPPDCVPPPPDTAHTGDTGATGDDTGKPSSPWDGTSAGGSGGGPWDTGGAVGRPDGVLQLGGGRCSCGSGSPSPVGWALAVCVLAVRSGRSRRGQLRA